MKFESYNLHYCRKNCRKLVLVELLHCYEVTTLVKKYNKTLFKKKRNKDFRPKKISEKTCPSQREKYYGVLRLNQTMSTLLTTSKCLQLNC